jgi:hypothetical protein
VGDKLLILELLAVAGFWRFLKWASPNWLSTDAVLDGRAGVGK